MFSMFSLNVSNKKIGQRSDDRRPPSGVGEEGIGRRRGDLDLDLLRCCCLCC